MATRLDELETLLNRIWSGELKHDQSEYISSCGTVACVCGWDFALDYYGGSLAEAERYSGAAWRHSTKKYELTTAEATLLFDGLSTKLLQQTTLSKLKGGESLECLAYIGISATDYNSMGVTVSSENEYTTNALKKFFDGTDVTVG